VETSTVRPSAASAWISFQKSRRVQQQQLRIGQRAGAERQPLLPAAGEFAGKLLLAAVEADALDHVARGAACIGQAIEPRDELQILPHREILIEAEALRHVADLALDLVGVAANVEAEAGPLAGVGRQQAAEHADGRGLAASVRAEEAIDRAALDLHREVMHDLAAAKRLRQAGDIDGDVRRG
jgi:hypothetical protein